MLMIPRDKEPVPLTLGFKLPRGDNSTDAVVSSGVKETEMERQVSIDLESVIPACLLGNFFPLPGFLEGLEFLSFWKRSFLPVFWDAFGCVQSLSMRSK